jgi:hypothetical protein
MTDTVWGIGDAVNLMAVSIERTMCAIEEDEEEDD